MEANLTASPSIRQISPDTYAVDVGAELVLVVTDAEGVLIATWCLAGVPIAEAQVGDA